MSRWRAVLSQFAHIDIQLPDEPECTDVREAFPMQVTACLIVGDLIVVVVGNKRLEFRPHEE